MIRKKEIQVSGWGLIWGKFRDMHREMKNIKADIKYILENIFILYDS